MKIGLTGSIACGKSTVSSFLRSLGYQVVDADAISRQLTAPGGAALPAVRKAFGGDVFDGDTLDRRALGGMVFADPAKLELLNSILHPMIISQIETELSSLSQPGKLVFADIPLLYECGMETMFDRIWVVSAARDTQIARLMTRDNLSEAEAVRRIDAQMPLEEKRRRADAVIDTNGPIEATQRQVKALLASPAGRRQA